MMSSVVSVAVFVFLIHTSMTMVDAVCTINVPCFPTPVDVLSSTRNINFTVTSVCGSPPEAFCSPTACGMTCNASDPANRHPKEYMTDVYTLPTFWKSKNLVRPVTIQIDFNQRVILHQITATFQYDYPSHTQIERSQDYGNSYVAIHHNAVNCLNSIGRAASATYTPLETVCMTISTSDTSKAISYMPRTEQAIARQLSTNSSVRDYFILTNVRYVLVSYITPASFDVRTADPTKYFFAIKDIDVQASCYCNGMSDQCNATSLGKCICQKNTRGDNCQLCNPLFNNKPWRYGIACEMCNCSGLAENCFYSYAKGYGVCQGCTSNTTGDFCHQCMPGFSRNSNSACMSCGCNLSGVETSLGICNQSTGVCICKQNVEGSKCDSCKDQFYGLTAANNVGCSICGCRVQMTVNGSNVCNKLTGQCPCLRGFAGRICNTCANGFYSNQSVNPAECKECSCDPSGSQNSSCNSSGQCYCKESFSGQKCQIIRASYFSSSVAQSQYSALTAVVDTSAAFYRTSSQFFNSRGELLYHVGYSVALAESSQSPTSLIFSIAIPTTSGYEMVVQYLTSFAFTGVSLTLNRQFAFVPYTCMRDGVQESITIPNNIIVLRNNLPLSSESSSFGTLCLSAGRYTVTLMLPNNSSAAGARILIKSLLVLPSYRYSSRYLIANTTTQSLVRFYYQQAFSQSTWSVNEAAGAPYLGYLYGDVYRAAQACQCNSIGSINASTCERYGGQCICKPNVTGLQCDECLPNHTNFTSGQGCSACGCNPFGTTNTSCNAQTGVCSCRPNVAGDKCNSCIVNYYGLNSGRGCSPCNCSLIYSSRQQCHENGTCTCKPGVGGEKCSQCIPGYYNLSPTGCTLCNCNPIGSLNSICNTTSASCSCKQNADGTSCERCKPGFYGYSSSYTNACLKCQCSGKTSQCSTATGFYISLINTTLSPAENNVALDGWRSLNANGFQSGTMRWIWEPRYSFFRGAMNLTNNLNAQELFFSAPSKYLGDKRGSYMLKLMFDLAQQSGSQPINSSLGDVILVGNNASYRLVTKLGSSPPVFPTFRSYEVTFDERFWKKDRTGGANVTSDEMIAVLGNVRNIYIRGKWTQALRQFTALANVRMEYSTSAMVGRNVSTNVENCTCPIGYSGLSCQQCSPGYTRAIPYGSAYSACVPCKCNNHATTCNPDNGICQECQHFTTGNNCEVCRPGYYGNATRGTASDCLSCPCPGGIGASNQFSPVCKLEADGLPNCTACQMGYTGRRCEICRDGYSGRPTIPGGICQRCMCSGNIDLSVTGNCDNVTGECLKCLNNTTGNQCQWCRSGTFGNALIPGNCRGCGCNAIGSFDSNCNNITGQCNCKGNVVGRTCDSCVVNSYNFTSGVGCTFCNCNAFGSNSLQCFENSTCSCKPHVMGEKCDRCMPGFYNLAQGCLPCNCSSNFTVENTTCDAVTGQCQCKRTDLGGNYSGRRCDQCSPNAFGTPPACTLCGELCYTNWNNYISQETRTLSNLMANTSALLALFGSTSYSQVNTQLQILNGNLTYASTVFEGAQYDTRTKEAQFRQIEASIVTFEMSVNRTEAQLQTLENYFSTTASFTGTVNLDSSTPSSFPSPFGGLTVTTATFNVPVTASPTSVTTMAQGYLNSANANNVSGTFIYSTIVENYNQIQSANRSINQAAIDISSAMTTLSVAAAQRSRASSSLDGSFQSTFSANAVELQSINVLVQSIKNLVNATAATENEARSLLATAQATMTSAELAVNSSRAEANAASQSASEMQISGSNLQNSATTLQSSAVRLKSNADALLFDAKQTATSVGSSINRVSGIRNQTQQVTDTANRVINQTIPVTMERIQSLSSQITSTSIDEAQINQTLVGAEDGLRRAQEVQRVSQQALNSSQETLANVRTVEASLRQSETLRNTTRSIQTANDQKIGEIQNITAFVGSRFRNLQPSGEQSRILINNTIRQVNDSLMCFADAKRIVDNATQTLQSAQSLATSAFLVHQNNTQKVASYASQIGSAHTTTTQQYLEIQQAQGNATQLLSDVTEAERLLAQYIEQNAELTRLQTESAALEAELDTLITQFDQTSARLSTCNKN